MILAVSWSELALFAALRTVLGLAALVAAIITADRKRS